MNAQTEAGNLGSHITMGGNHCETACVSERPSCPDVLTCFLTPAATLPAGHPMHSSDTGAGILLSHDACCALVPSWHLAAHPAPPSPPPNPLLLKCFARGCRCSSVARHCCPPLPLPGPPSSPRPFPPRCCLCQEERALNTERFAMIRRWKSGRRVLVTGRRNLLGFTPLQKWGCRPQGPAPHRLVLKPTGTGRPQITCSSSTMGRLRSQGAWGSFASSSRV